MVRVRYDAVICYIKSQILQDTAQPPARIGIGRQFSGTVALYSAEPGIGSLGMYGVRIGIEP